MLVALAGSGDSPDGWQPVPAAALQEQWRDGSSQRFARVAGDFDGDGEEDLAILLRSSRSEALWVRLSGTKAPARWLMLDEVPLPHIIGEQPPVMALDRVAPGVVAYACFDSDTDCNSGLERQRPKLVLKFPAIEYFRMGSSSSIFFWSNSRKKFLRVWTSD